MQQSCEQQTCSSNALVHVTQCVFCCERKKRDPDPPLRLPWSGGSGGGGGDEVDAHLDSDGLNLVLE